MHVLRMYSPLYFLNKLITLGYARGATMIRVMIEIMAISLVQFCCCSFVFADNSVERKGRNHHKVSQSYNPAVA